MNLGSKTLRGIRKYAVQICFKFILSLLPLELPTRRSRSGSLKCPNHFLPRGRRRTDVGSLKRTSQCLPRGRKRTDVGSLKRTSQCLPRGRRRTDVGGLKRTIQCLPRGRGGAFEANQLLFSRERGICIELNVG